MGFDDNKDIFHLADENDIYLCEEGKDKDETHTTLSQEYVTGALDNSFRLRMSMFTCMLSCYVKPCTDRYNVLNVGVGGIILARRREELTNRSKEKLLSDNNNRKYNNDHRYRREMSYKRQPTHQKNSYVKKVR